jgi:toxin ParE1/3/4
MAQEVTFKVVWTEPAICDLERIDHFLRRRNPAVANRVGENVLKKAGLLAQHPELGPVWEEDPAWRYLVLRPYRLYYRILEESRVVEISHLRHGSRDNPTADDLRPD